MKKKILFIVESLNVGGAEKALVSLLQFMDYNRYDVTLKVISASGAFMNDAESIDQLKIKKVTSPKESKIGSLLNAFKIKALYSWMPPKLTGNYLCRGYDVVIAFCEGYLTKWVGSSDVKAKKIAWVHTDMVNNDWPVATGVFSSFSEEKKAYSNFDEVIAVSGIATYGMKSRFQCKKVSLIYNILDPKLIEKSKERIDSSQKSRLNIVGVGRLETVKGFDRLIEAVGILINQCQMDISLTLVGDGSQRGTLEEAIREKGLGKRVTLCGTKSNPYPYMAKADLFACPSRHEGFNISILEAMMLGKPIIASESAGPSEILGNGKYGLLAENSVEGLVEGIAKIYNNPQMRIDLQKMARLRSNDFDTSSQVLKFENTLERLI